MRIQHNIAGINSYRNLGVNQRNLKQEPGEAFLWLPD